MLRSVYLGGIYIGGDSIDLLPAYCCSPHQQRGGPSTTHGTGASEGDACSGDAWIVLRNSNGEAGSVVSADIVTAYKAVTVKDNVTGAGGGKVQIMVQKLPKLHEHVCQVVAGLHSVRVDQAPGHPPCTRLPPRPSHR